MKKIILSICYILFTFGAVGMRIAELKVMINPKNGFYYGQYNVIAVILSIIAILICVNLALGAMVTLRKESKERSIPKKSIILGIASLIMAFGILFDLYKSIAVSTLQYDWTDYLVFILSIITALLFCFYGLFRFLGKKAPASLSLIPIIWSVAMLVINYTQFNGIALSSENIVDILSMSLFMVFWLYHSKIINHIVSAKTLNTLFVFGSLACLMGFVSTLPRFFVEYDARIDMFSNYPMVSFSNLSASLYVICFIGVLYFQYVEKSSKSLDFIDAEANDDNLFSPTERPKFTVETIDEGRFISKNIAESITDDEIDAIINESLNLDNNNNN